MLENCGYRDVKAEDMTQVFQRILKEELDAFLPTKEDFVKVTTGGISADVIIFGTRGLPKPCPFQGFIGKLYIILFYRNGLDI